MLPAVTSYSTGSFHGCTATRLLSRIVALWKKPSRMSYGTWPRSYLLTTCADHLGGRTFARNGDYYMRFENYIYCDQY
ncbi:unnamed protein product [Linum trigynum]|uniref:Uncharacterized protein n=1 Tax=Linum trigynum TaxID=586398 RepID=A0AAV2DTG6_9ROSI